MASEESPESSSGERLRGGGVEARRQVQGAMHAKMPRFEAGSCHLLTEERVGAVGNGVQAGVRVEDHAGPSRRGWVDFKTVLSFIELKEEATRLLAPSVS